MSDRRVIFTKLDDGSTLSVSQEDPVVEQKNRTPRKEDDRHLNTSSNDIFIYRKAWGFADKGGNPWVNISQQRSRLLVKNGVLFDLDQRVVLDGVDITFIKGRDGLEEYTVINVSKTKDSLVTFQKPDKLKLDDGSLVESYIIKPNKIVKFVYTEPYWRISNVDTVLDRDSIISEAKCFTMAMVTKYG